MKPVVSVHIPKTAGTSFGESLALAFDKLVYYDYDDKPINQSRDVRMARAIAHSQLRHKPSHPVIHGHFLPRKYLYLAQPKSAFFVTWLREPIARLESNYRFWRDTPPPAKIPPLRQRMLDEKWSFFDFATEPRFQNLYHQFFEGFDIELFDFIGLTEHYEDDLERCAQMLKLPLQLTLRNTRKSSEPMELTQRQWQEIRDFHRQDIDLYEQVKCRYDT